MLATLKFSMYKGRKNLQALQQNGKTFFAKKYGPFFLTEKRDRQISRKLWRPLQFNVIDCYVTIAEHIGVITKI